jgi:hypothetical protein
MYHGVRQAGQFFIPTSPGNTTWLIRWQKI